MSLASVHWATVQWAAPTDRPVAALRGEVDLSNVDDLHAQLVTGVSNRALGLVLDLSPVRYLDSTGLRLLFRLARQLEDRQQALAVVVPPDARIGPVLALAGLTRAVPVFETVPQALAGLVEQGADQGAG